MGPRCLGDATNMTSVLINGKPRSKLTSSQRMRRSARVAPVLNDRSENKTTEFDSAMTLIDYSLTIHAHEFTEDALLYASSPYDEWM